MESALLAKKKAQECVEASAEKEDLDGLEMEGEEEEPGEEDPEGRATHLQRVFFAVSYTHLTLPTKLEV